MKQVFTAVCAALFLICTAVDSASAQADTDTKRVLEKIQQLAKQGNAEAEYHLGMLYNNGIGVPKDSHKAYQSFVKAAALGDPLAAYKVGCYQAGQYPGVVPVDLEKALENKLVAAQAGYALAQLDVAAAYLQKSMPSEARPWLQRAAEQGDARAQYNLSVLHLRGLAGPPDQVAGYAYFKLAKLTAEGSINAKAQASLNELGAKMSAVELARANALIEAWRPEQTQLTLKAMRGFEASRALAATVPD